MASNDNESIVDDRRYADFWKTRFPTTRLNAVTPTAIEQAKLEVANKGRAPQTVLHYL